MTVVDRITVRQLTIGAARCHVLEARGAIQYREAAAPGVLARMLWTGGLDSRELNFARDKAKAKLFHSGNHQWLPADYICAFRVDTLGLLMFVAAIGVLIHN